MAATTGALGDEPGHSTSNDASAVATTGSDHGITNGKGWDGKLRLPKKATLANPEALSDPEYSDEEHVLPGDELEADEDLLDGEDETTTELDVTHSRVKSIPKLRLERFKQATHLVLRQNSIQNIEGLESLAETLTDLDLYDNLIGHIRNLEGLTRLKMLDLSFNKIKHIKHIETLVKVEELFLVANKISHIENLDTLVKIRMLELGSNRIREIQNLDALQNLQELYLAKNKITEISNLSHLPKLRLLSIQSNRITDLSPLAQVPSLQELFVSHNMLTSITGLEHNTKLKLVDISNNKITSLRGLEACKEIEEVWASYNLIGDFADVEAVLKDKKGLETVYFEGNPLQLRGPAVYRNKVRLALEQVKQIDATYVRTS